VYTCSVGGVMVNLKGHRRTLGIAPEVSQELQKATRTAKSISPSCIHSCTSYIHTFFVCAPPINYALGLGYRKCNIFELKSTLTWFLDQPITRIELRLKSRAISVITVYERYRGTAHIGALARPHAARKLVFEHPTACPIPHSGRIVSRDARAVYRGDALYNLTS
jgi:hypothetical protein